MSFIKDLAETAQPQIDAILSNPQENPIVRAITLLYGLIDNDMGGTNPSLAARLAMSTTIEIGDVNDAASAAEVIFQGYRLVKLVCGELTGADNDALLEGCRRLSIKG